MTVHQEQPIAIVEPTTIVRVPRPRRALDDQRPATTTAPPPPGWGSTADRRMAQWLMAMAVCLGVYIAVFITLGARVWD